MSGPTTNCDVGGWIQVYSGATFFPLDPNPDVLTLDDVAIPLSRMCRYGGHCLQFYSVAEHCVLMARHLRAAGYDDARCLQALMHDASEAFIADIVRPVKGKLAGYKDAEERLMRALSPRFGFDWPMTPVVRDLDASMIAVERPANMLMTGVPDDLWGVTVPAPTNPKIELQFWNPDQAAAEFFAEFFALGGVE